MTRKTNNEKIMEYLEENPNPISTTNLANAISIDIKNISRYLKELEKKEKINREIKQIGRVRLVNISLKIKEEKIILEGINKQNIQSKAKLDTTRKEEKPTDRKKVIRTTEAIHTIKRNQERIHDIYFEADTIENLSKKYEIPKEYLLRIKKNLQLLKYPPRIKNNHIVCYQCGKSKDKRLVFHHNHETGELIALVCDSCNQKLDNDESNIIQIPSLDNSLNSKIQPKTVKENRSLQEAIFTEQMIQEVKIYSRTIPLDKVRIIARKTLENSRNMLKGIKYYLTAWRKRYNEYKIEKPENFLIDEYESMQKTLIFLNEMKELEEKLKNRESVD